LASVLALAVCAMACGARSLYAIAQWGRQHRRLVCEALGIKRLTTPSHPQLHRVFAALDVQAFEAVLGKWLAGQGRELEAARALLESLDLQGQVVTGDALLAQRDICRKIRKKGASGSSG